MLAAALSALPADARPYPPFHLGGPAPRIEPGMHRRLVLWVGGWTIANAPAAGALVPAVEAMRAQLDGSDRERELRLEEQASWREAPSALSLLRRTIVHASRWGSDEISASAAMLAARLLMESAGPRIARAFVEALDPELLRLELAGALALREPDAPAVERVLWRTGPPEGADHWIARLAGGRFALLYRTPPRFGEPRHWVYAGGTRDDVLAAVPDVHFAHAAKAL